MAFPGRRGQLSADVLQRAGLRGRARRWQLPGQLLLGFILFNFGWPLRHVRFTPHVGVFSAERELLDVTPHGARDDHPLLQHPGTDEQFQAACAFGPMDLIYR
jgi:hypothetical protein